jgi:uncharacterized integral membrane protein
MKQEFVHVYAPWTLPLVYVLLEVLVIGCALAGFVHAWRARRRGDLVPLFTYAVIFVYGLVMEIVSYNFVQNFTHAQFTVMFYGRQLPLYITAVYPAMLYTGIMTARRLGLRPAYEGFAAGLLIVAMDMPFDICGPVVGWWSWSDTDPRLAYRWLDVPVTSYYWHLAFGGILASMTTVIGARVRSLGRLVALTLPTAVLVIVLGMVAFTPFHALAALGLSHGTLVGAALLASAAVAALAPHRLATRPDRLLLAIPAAFYAFHLVVAFRFTSGAPLKLATILAVIAFAAAVNVYVHRERG